MPVIPPTLLQRILAFCARKATGRITLHIHQGRLVSYAVTETGSVHDLTDPLTYPEPSTVTLEDLVS